MSHLEIMDTGNAIEVWLCSGGRKYYLTGPFISEEEAIEYCDRMHPFEEVMTYHR